jgi:hypothetical protein
VGARPGTANRRWWILSCGRLPGRVFDTVIGRYHQRIYRIIIQRKTSEEEITESYNRVLKRGRLLYVYLGEEWQRKFSQSYSPPGRRNPQTMQEMSRLCSTQISKKSCFSAHQIGVSNHWGVGTTLADLRKIYYCCNLIGTTVPCVRPSEIRSHPPRKTPDALSNGVRLCISDAGWRFQYEGSRFLVLTDEAVRMTIVQRLRYMRTTLLHLFTTHGCPYTLIMDQGRDIQGDVPQNWTMNNKTRYISDR